MYLTVTYCVFSCGFQCRPGSPISGWLDLNGVGVQRSKTFEGILNNHKQNTLKWKNHLHQVGKKENFHVYISVLLALRRTGLFRPLEWVSQCILAHALLESIQRPLVFIWRKCSLYQEEAS